MIVNITLKTDKDNPSFDKLLQAVNKEKWELINMGAEKVTIIPESDQR